MTTEAVAALAAGRETDALVAERVMGEPPMPEHLKRQGYFRNYAPHSTDIRAAWPVLEEMRRRGHRIAVQNAGNGWGCSIETDPGTEIARSYWEVADTAPLAICRASLRTLED